jgi:hypothetical protein
MGQLRVGASDDQRSHLISTSISTAELPAVMKAVFAALFGLLLPACLQAVPLKSGPLPVVIWHGLGDSYNNPGIEELAEAVRTRFGKDQFVWVARLANDTKGDQLRMRLLPLLKAFR